jgi:UDP-N-acetylglucosamine diphosphorylase/glucosamine-1-phosphate N-acetyltransferase
MEIGLLLAVIILAAGKGTRMNSDLPKVLHKICGKTLIQHVLRTARELDPERVVVIVGHRRDEVKAELRDCDAECVVQEPQLGTGHAVLQTAPLLSEFTGDVIVLSGDVPLLKTNTLKQLIRDHQKSGVAVTVLSTMAPDPKGYGRIVRKQDGSFSRIVEEREASAVERQIAEINSGIYCFRAGSLFDALRSVGADNSKGEYYLTDVIGILRGQGKTVQAVNLAEFREVQGINTQAELANAEEAAVARRTERTS